MIKGVSDQVRLPRLGKIRLGEKRENEKGVEYPKALDYFVVPEEIKAIYGEKPRELDVMLPMENRESFFPQAYKRYGSAKGLICRGDGELAMCLDGKSGELEEIQCPGKDCPYYQKGECKQVGNLQVSLYKVPGLGIYQIDTSSYNSIINLNSGIKLIRGMLGRISWIPLVLKVEMQEAHPTVNGNRIKTIIPVMNLTCKVSVEQLMRRATQPLPVPKAAIDNPGVDEKPELLFPKVPNSEPGVTQDKDEIEKVGLDGEKVGEPSGDEPKEEPKKDFLTVNLHNLRRKLKEENYWNGEEDYRTWLLDEFNVQSSKELNPRQKIKAVEILSGWMNKVLKEKKERK